MRISFFEEFPSKRNLSKLRLCKAHKVYIASENLKEFRKYRRKIKNSVYWPVLKKEDGYWISPFADAKALKRVLSEIPKNQEVMLDLELPLNRLLIIKNFLDFWKNKKLISEFIKSHKKVILCEHPFDFGLKILGLSYNVPAERRIKMIYSSIIPFAKFFLKNAKAKRIGIGCIAKGIYGDEKIMKPEDLKKDLEILEGSKKEIIIFRLGGINKEYAKIINRYK